MEEIEVTAKFSPQGKIIPISFMLNGRVQKVYSIGRSWDAKDGHHVLVMGSRNRAFHLLFSAEKRIWFLMRGDQTPTIPTI